MEGITAWNVAGRLGPIRLPSFTCSNSSINMSPDIVTSPSANATVQPVDLVTSMPPSTKNTKARPTMVLYDAREWENDKLAANTGRVSMLAELNAITKETN
jgi:hypothetical protein